MLLHLLFRSTEGPQDDAPHLDEEPKPPADVSHATDSPPPTGPQSPETQPIIIPARESPANKKTRAELETEMRAAFRTMPEPLHERILSGPVRTIIGADNPDRDYRTAMEGLRKLGRSLRPDDVNALREFLARPMPAKGSMTMRGIEYNAIRNDVLDVLIKQDTLPEDLHLDLISMYLDLRQDDVWRTYSAQFLPIYWEARWGSRKGGAELTDTDLHAQTNIRDTLREALAERDNSVAGTALLGMDGLRKSRNAFTREEVRTAAVELTLDPQTSEASRVTALRICGQLGADEVLEETRIIAQTGATTMLRLAAMATLGDLGDRQDAGLLAALAEENERFKSVTATAIASIEKRN